MAIRRKRHNHRWNKKIPVEHTGFYPYLQRFIEHKESLGCSKDTARTSESALRLFIQWCDERGIEGPQTITKPILDRYQKHLFYYRKSNGEPMSFSSQNTVLRTIKSFFKWLAQHNHLPYNPASEMAIPKRHKQLPRTILSLDSIKQLMDTPDIDTVSGLRDRVIFETFYGTAMRRTELANLKFYDLDLSRQVLLVRKGKGGKDRWLPVNDSLVQWLNKYQSDVREALASPLDDDALFITDYGEPFTGDRLGWMVKSYMKKAGLEVQGSCHLFRHAAATHMLENGADIRFIQALLGHDDLNSTEIYTRVSVEKLREVVNVTHPGNRKP